MENIDIDSISIILGIITGIIFLVIYSISSHFLRKKALQKIKRSLLEGEYIVKEPQNVFVIDVFMPFAVAGFTGMFIIPFIIYPELQHISGYMGGISREYLPLCIMAVVILIFINFWTACLKVIFTNKRIFYAWSFNFLYKFKDFFNKFDNLYYSDIKDYQYENVLQIETLTLHLYNGKNYILSGFKDLKNIQSIIEKNS
jgi:hypothetical protein